MAGHMTFRRNPAHYRRAVVVRRPFAPSTSEPSTSVLSHCGAATRTLCPLRASIVLALLVAFLVERPAWAVSPQRKSYERDVRPVLTILCFRCHSQEKNKSGIRLDNLDPDMSKPGGGEAWHDVLDQLNSGEMPPAEAKQPTLDERRLLTEWLEAELREAAEAKRFRDGRVSTRRLTRYEYANTMRDLLGVKLDFAKHLPPEPASTTGFQNDGAVLEMSPTQIETYLEAARRGLAEAIVSGERPKPHEYSTSTTAIGNLPTRKVAGHEPVKPEFVLDLTEFPRHGEFELKITARAAVPGNEGFPKIRVSMGHVPGIIHVPRGTIGEADISQESQTFVFRGRMEDFPQPGPIAFGNSGFKGMIVMIDFLDADGNELRYPDRQYSQRPPKPKKKKGAAPKEEKSEPETSSASVSFGERLEIEVTRVEFRSPVHTSWPPTSHKRLLFESAHSGDEARRVRELLRPFMTRAFRRPVTSAEVERTAELFDAVRPETASFEEAIRETFASVLVSPHFLYVVETRERQSESQRVTDWELASRLSYFLWSSAPDQRLLNLAGDERLHQPEVLKEQVDRMLSDSRSSEFTERFVDQWLDMDALNRIAVNPEFFPDFDNQLKSQMRRETQSCFSHILHQNRSALELLSSNWTMLNRSLATHYGIAGPRSSQFEHVVLDPAQRGGGLLWHGAFHLTNSNGEDSHPIKRAVWVLDRLLDSPPASPPADVPELNAESPDFAKLTLKDQLAVHRKKESCANCHRKIDPWGIPLENFDAVGRWRTEVPAHKKRPRVVIDAESVLPDGTVLNGVRQLEKYLLEKRSEEFARSVVKRIMTYGLGRSLDFGDRETFQMLTGRFTATGYSLQSLITDFVQSDAFQRK